MDIFTMFGMKTRRVTLTTDVTKHFLNVTDLLQYRPVAKSSKRWNTFVISVPNDFLISLRMYILFCNQFQFFILKGQKINAMPIDQL